MVSIFGGGVVGTVEIGMIVVSMSGGVTFVTIDEGMAKVVGAVVDSPQAETEIMKTSAALTRKLFMGEA